MSNGGNYAGDVTPQAAWQGLVAAPGARLIDVRTQPEWNFVGIPDLSQIGKKTVLTSWQVYPAMTVDSEFVAKLRGQIGSAEGPFYFICRSGARSRAAAIALTEAGLGPCFNVAGGFEGDRDAASHRGKSGGWKVAGLPWVQD
jgi:rhodanese-related sulfurtransferase